MDRLGLTEKFEASSLTDRLNDLIPRPRRSGAGEPLREEGDGQRHLLHLHHPSHPGELDVPFPYLTPEDFDAARTDLVLSIRRALVDSR